VAGAAAAVLLLGVVFDTVWGGTFHEAMNEALARTDSGGVVGYSAPVWIATFAVSWVLHSVAGRLLDGRRVVLASAASGLLPVLLLVLLDRAGATPWQVRLPALLYAPWMGALAGVVTGNRARAAGGLVAASLAAGILFAVQPALPDLFSRLDLGEHVLLAWRAWAFLSRWLAWVCILAGERLAVRMAR
jgi:hypothetical protein